jgi:hypothetical protein
MHPPFVSDDDTLSSARDLFLVAEPDTAPKPVRCTPVDIAVVRLLVHGPVALVPTRHRLAVVLPPVEMWVNEEGLLQPEMRPNVFASLLAGELLVGPAVCSRRTRKQELTGFTAAEVASLGWVPDGVVPVPLSQYLADRTEPRRAG